MSLSRIPSGAGRMAQEAVKALETKGPSTLSGLKASTSGALERAQDNRRSGSFTSNKTRAFESSGSSTSLASIAHKTYQPKSSPTTPPPPTPTLSLVEALKKELERTVDTNQNTSSSITRSDTIRSRSGSVNSFTSQTSTSPAQAMTSNEPVYASIIHNKTSKQQQMEDTQSVNSLSSSYVDTESEDLTSVSNENNSKKSKASLSSKMKLRTSNLKRKLGNRIRHAFSKNGHSSSSVNKKKSTEEKKQERLNKDMKKFAMKSEAAQKTLREGIQARQNYWDLKDEIRDAKRKKIEAKKELKAYTKEIKNTKTKVKNQARIIALKGKLGLYRK